jgi:hypothetical protein
VWSVAHDADANTLLIHGADVSSNDKTLLAYVSSCAHIGCAHRMQNSQLISELLSDCRSTLSNAHEQTFVLRPPNNADCRVPTAFAAMKSHPGFDARLCYGTVSLALEWSQLKPSPSSVKRTALADHIALAGEQQAETNGTRTTFTDSPVHRWASMHTTGSTVHCALCHGRIWLKSCVQCGVCGQIVHQKCATKAEQSVPCVPMGVEQHAHLIDSKDRSSSSSSLPVSSASSRESHYGQLCALTHGHRCISYTTETVR